MHHNLTESSEKNGSCFTILAIVALASGGLVGGSAWLKGYSFLPFFVAGAGFIFSIYWIVQISEKGIPIWKGIEHYCNLWRATRTGILLYGARHDAPAIFLPWPASAAWLMPMTAFSSIQRTVSPLLSRSIQKKQNMLYHSSQSR